MNSFRRNDVIEIDILSEYLNASPAPVSTRAFLLPLPYPLPSQLRVNSSRIPDMNPSVLEVVWSPEGWPAGPPRKSSRPSPATSSEVTIHGARRGQSSPAQCRAPRPPPPTQVTPGTPPTARPPSRSHPPRARGPGWGAPPVPAALPPAARARCLDPRIAPRFPATPPPPAWSRAAGEGGWSDPAGTPGRGTRSAAGSVVAPWAGQKPTRGGGADSHRGRRRGRRMMRVGMCGIGCGRAWTCSARAPGRGIRGSNGDGRAGSDPRREGGCLSRRAWLTDDPGDPGDPSTGRAAGRWKEISHRRPESPNATGWCHLQGPKNRTSPDVRCKRSAFARWRRLSIPSALRWWRGPRFAHRGGGRDPSRSRWWALPDAGAARCADPAGSLRSGPPRGTAGNGRTRSSRFPRPHTTTDSTPRTGNRRKSRRQPSLGDPSPRGSGAATRAWVRRYSGRSLAAPIRGVRHGWRHRERRRTDTRDYFSPRSWAVGW